MKISPLPLPSQLDNFLGELENEFLDKGLKRKKSYFYLEIVARDLRNTLGLLKNKFEFLFLVDFSYYKDENRFLYILKNLDLNLTIVVSVQALKIMPSMKKIFCGVVWAEKIYSQLHLIEFKGHVFRSLDEEGRFYDLSIYPEFDYTSKQASAAHEIAFHRYSSLYTNFFGQLALDIEVKDDLVTRAKFLLNPKCKNLYYDSFSGSFLDFVRYLEKSRPMVFFESLILFYKAIEEEEDFLLHQELQMHRMLFLELERIKFIYHQVYLFFNNEGMREEKDAISDLIQGFNKTLLRPAINFLLKNQDSLILDAQFVESISTIVKRSLNLAKSLKDKISFESILSREEPYKFLEAGISGSVLRSFGLDFDQRQRQHYFLYDKVETQSNLSTSGWTQDLFLLKLADLEESCRVIKHLLKSLSPISQSLSIFSDVLDTKLDISREWYYADLEGAAGLSSIVFKLDSEGKILNLRFRSEVLYQLQKFEYIDYPEPKEQYFKKIYSVPLFLLET
jgi:hypothetical protein